MDPNADAADRSNLRRGLERAVEGLTYPSDADHPFRVRVEADGRGHAFTPAQFLAFLGESENRGPIEEQPAKVFFDELTFSPGLVELHRLLEARLIGLQVFRIGRVNVEIHIVGRTESGDVAVLSTRSLET